VLSGSINGNVALTIRATKIASVLTLPRRSWEVLHASEENRPQIQRLGDRLGSWYTPMAIAIRVGKLGTSAASRSDSLPYWYRDAMPAADFDPVAIIGAISVGAKLGIIIKDPSILEKMGHLPHSDRRQKNWHADLRQADCHIY